MHRLLPVASSTVVDRCRCDRQTAYNHSCIQSRGDAVPFAPAPSDSNGNNLDIDVDAVDFDVPCWEKDVDYNDIPEKELLSSTRRHTYDVDNECNYEWDDSTSNVPFWWM